MKIAKPLLLVLTPIGVGVGLVEGYRVAGGLVVLMAAMLVIVGMAIATVVMTIRRERRRPSAPAPAPQNDTSATDESPRPHA